MGKRTVKTAVIQEWLVNYTGSEKCVESFVNLWPNSDVFALVDFLSDQDRKRILQGKKATTSIIQKLPFSKTKYRNYLSLFPLAVEQFNVSKYDVIISSAHAVAKGILTNAQQMHISYCHSPMRYAWDLYFQYLEEANLTSGIKSWYARKVLHKTRLWDFLSAQRVDYFIANSNHIAKRIKKVYRRDAEVIYPPVDVDLFSLQEKKDDYYLIVSRLVPYKKVGLVVNAFAQMPDKKLVVIGDGPNYEKIKKSATKNVEMLGYQTYEQLVEYMQNAKAFLYAAEEDFGIAIVEAQACGTPVIAYKVGGASETVIDGKTGVLFDDQTESSVIEGVKTLDDIYQSIDPAFIRKHSEQFSRMTFESKIKQFVENKWEGFSKY